MRVLASALAVVSALSAAGVARADEPWSKAALASALDQCRPDVTRATEEELIAAAEAKGLPDFAPQRAEGLPVMTSVLRENAKSSSPSVTVGLLSDEGQLHGVNGWIFSCIVETRPAMPVEIAAWATSVYPEPDPYGWSGTRTAAGELVKDGFTELFEDVETRLTKIQPGERIVILSVSSDRKGSTAVTRILEKIN